MVALVVSSPTLLRTPMPIAMCWPCTSKMVLPSIWSSWVAAPLLKTSVATTMPRYPTCRMVFGSMLITWLSDAVGPSTVLDTTMPPALAKLIVLLSIVAEWAMVPWQGGAGADGVRHVDADAADAGHG